jgi:protein-S-isoprenylcysteine O-methyltransferase Ste14
MAGAAEAAVAMVKAPRRHWVDWIGFGVYLGLALWIFVRSASLGLWLLPIVSYELLIAGSFLTRQPLRAQLPGWQPQLAGYLGTFLPLVFLQSAQIGFPHWLQGYHDPRLRVVGLGFWMFGLLLSMWTILYLRKAFSLVPQARVLITAGPYQIARHPIYLAYILQYTGMFVAGRMTVPFSLFLVAFSLVTYWRTRLEEQVLTQAFPEYTRYQQMVGRFGPRLSRPAGILPR